MSKRVALVVGAGGVLGSAICAEFSTAGYTVVGLRRAVPADVTGTTQFVGCDLADAEATADAAAEQVERHGPVDVLVCNAAHLTMAPFAELTLGDFDLSWRVSVGSAVGAAHAVLPGMNARRSGAVLITGATTSTRGTARFSAFASAKFALRGFAQSLAREYQPAGVHVVHVNIDGLLRGSKSVARFGGREENTLDPVEVAKTFRQLAEQHPSAWTHEIDLRPYTERF